MTSRAPLARLKPSLSCAMHLFTALLCFGVIYRGRLLWHIIDGHTLLVPPSRAGSGLLLLPQLTGELLLAGGAGLAALALHAGARRLAALGGRWLRPTLQVAGHLLAVSFLLLLVVIHQAHYNLLVVMNTGLSSDVVQEVLSAGLQAAPGYLAMVKPLDMVFMALPLVLYLVFVLIPQAAARWRDRAAAAVVVGILLLNLLRLHPAVPRVLPEVEQNPFIYTASDVIRDRLRSTQGLEPGLVPDDSPRMVAKRPRTWRTRGKLRPPLPGKKPRSPTVKASTWLKLPFDVQQRSVRLIHPSLVTAVTPKKKVPRVQGVRWNVVLVIMESVGLRYVFERATRGQVPMPFLQQLSARGLTLANHYSTNNTSPSAIFAIFTGLYSMPRPAIYSLRKGLRYPSMISLLPPGYDHFMVSPTPMRWYFPLDYMRHRGPRELVDYHTIPVKRFAPRMRSYCKHEVESASYFLQRLQRVGPGPFFAIYTSCVAHWPYPDYGQRYRRFPTSLKALRKISLPSRMGRYRNNLYLLDRQIKRIHDDLARRKLLDRTILVVVGDHGQAFGQHQGNWLHSRKSFEENFQAPAVFYQPRLFKPRKVTRPTTHADIAPTILDAINVPYNPRLFQGESLFQDVFARRFIFSYGNDDTLCSVSTNRIKVQLQFKRERCRVFDLAADPGERRPLACDKYRAQHKATLQFYRYQQELLLRFNEACQRGEPFHNQRHPSPGSAGHGQQQDPVGHRR